MELRIVPQRRRFVPRLITIPAEVAADLAEQGLRVVGIRVLEEDADGVPTNAVIELGPLDEES